MRQHDKGSYRNISDFCKLLFTNSCARHVLGIRIMKFQNDDHQILISWLEGKSQGNSIRLFNVCLVVILVTLMALPSNVSAQCKTVSAGTMSLCVPSGWEFEKEIDEDNTALITLTNESEEKVYFFMNVYDEEGEFSLDEFLVLIQELAIEELDENLKWNPKKTTTFQSREARQVSGNLFIDGEKVYASIVVFNGTRGFKCAICYIGTQNITSFQNDEIVKTFRIVK